MAEPSGVGCHQRRVISPCAAGSLPAELRAEAEPSASSGAAEDIDQRGRDEACWLCKFKSRMPI